MKQSERERIYDDILQFLEKGKTWSVEAIVSHTNEYYKDRFKVLSELKSKGLVKEHVSEHETQNILGGGTFTERDYSYSISDEGRELVRKGGLKRAARNIALKSFKENVWGWTAFLGVLIPAIYFGVENYDLKKEKSEASKEIQQLTEQLQSTEEENMELSETDTTN